MEDRKSRNIEDGGSNPPPAIMSCKYKKSLENRRYYARHREELLEKKRLKRSLPAEKEKSRLYRLRNKDKIRTYYQSRREKYRSYNKSYYLKNREKIRLRNRLYYLKNRKNYLSLAGFWYLELCERLESDAEFYAEYRKKMREYYRKKNDKTRKREYRPRVSRRIPDCFVKGADILDTRSVFLETSREKDFYGRELAIERGKQMGRFEE